MFCALCMALAASLGAGSARAQSSSPQYVYSATQSTSGPTNLNGFVKDAITGSLSPLAGPPSAERLDGAAMAVDALGRFLFVVNPGNNDISMFQIDSTTGALTEVPASPFASGPYSPPSSAPITPLTLSTEPSGDYLYVGYRNTSDGGTVNSFVIDAQHLALVPTQQMSVQTPLESPVAMGTDPRGRNLYAGYGPPPNSGTLSSGVEVYQIDPASGALTEAANVTAGEFGRSMAIDPFGRFLYLGHGNLEGFVDGWQLSPVDSLPGDPISGVMFNTGEFPEAMAVDNSGKFLYVWTTAANVYIYAIDQTSGDIAEVAGSPQAYLLSDHIAADPQGPYLYALDGAGVHAYQIDPQTGLLTELAGSPYAVSGNSGPLGIAITGSNTSIAPVSGPYPQFDTAQVTFPDTVVTTTSSVSDRMVNNGSQLLLINSITISGANPGDFSESSDCPTSLNPGAYCTISITFAPAAAGLRQAALVVADNGPGGQQSVAVAGTGLAAQAEVTLVPGSLPFASILAGSTSGAQTITLTNSGYATLHVSNLVLAGANPGDFSFDNGCTAPVAVGNSCSISVRFAPAAAGQRTAQILVSDDAPDSPQSISLSGSATDPYTLSPAGSSSTSATVLPGAMAQYGLELAPATGFSGIVQLQCSGAPVAASCSVSPSMVQVSSTPVPITVSVTTTSAALAAPNGFVPSEPSGALWLLLAGALLLPAFLAAMRRGADRRASRARWAGIALIGALLAAMALAGCAGGSNTTSSLSGGNPSGTSTPQGTSKLTVAATSGKVTEQIQLTLTVQ
jgi:6-phosphogluconolactonase (cycloisomerase 2 family)